MMYLINIVGVGRLIVESSKMPIVIPFWQLGNPSLITCFFFVLYWILSIQAISLQDWMMFYQTNHLIFLRLERFYFKVVKNKLHCQNNIVCYMKHIDFDLVKYTVAIYLFNSGQTLTVIMKNYKHRYVVYRQCLFLSRIVK